MSRSKWFHAVSCSNMDNSWHTILFHCASILLYRQVFYLFQSIELVTRRHLHLDKVTELPIQQVAIEDCLKDQSILVKWEGIAKLPAKHEAYSIKLLRAIVTLWTKVRCFAFVKGWNEHFQTKAKFQKHGTRRSLKRKATE